MIRTVRILSILAASLMLGATLEAQRAPVAPALFFEENRGQTDPRVRFLARGSGMSLFLTSSEAVLALREAGPVRLGWIGGSAGPRIGGEGELPGKVSYLVGDASRWKAGIPTWSRVRYAGLYPGIDLVFYGDGRRLEYDLVVAPGADPRAVRLAVTGAERLAVDPASGELVLELGGSELRFSKPFSYQEVDGVRREVASRYRLLGPAEVGFEVAAWDRERPLVIDPVLVYSTYLGGGYGDEGMAISVDEAGNAYVAGSVQSRDFPTTGGQRIQGGWDAFVTKLDPDGGLVFSTFLGGNALEWARGIALDGEGNIYLAGFTRSTDFPLVNPIPAPGHAARGDAFVTKLDPTGSHLLYSTRLGGSEQDEAAGIAVDAAGHAYVAGQTGSADFPVQDPIFPFRTFPSSLDLFVAKLGLDGSSLVYSTWIGSGGYDRATGIAVDAAGRAVVTGQTEMRDFPWVNDPQPPSSNGTIGVVAKLDAAGSSLVYARSLGNQVNAVVTDAAGHAYVSGDSYSAGVPMVNALQPVRAGWADAFLARLGPLGGLVFSTYLGGSQSERGTGIALDPAGRIYVTGGTSSPDFPLRDPVQSACVPDFGIFGCVPDAFVVKLSPTASEILFSTFLGGSVGVEGDYEPSEPDDQALAIAADPRGNAYVTGWTYSTDFPSVDAVQPHHAGSEDYGGTTDAFVAKIATGSRPPDCSGAAASPAVIWPPNGKMVPVSVLGVTDPDGDPVTIKITGITQDEPGAAFLGIGSSLARVKAERDGKGDGRVYHILFESTDPSGASCSGEVTVCVPHDRGKGSCVDGGALFPSSR